MGEMKVNRLLTITGTVVVGLTTILGVCGISMADISKVVKAGMTKINFGEGMRMNYIRYFNEFSQTLAHEHHVWRIARASKDKLKEDLKDIIRAVGSEGKASLF